MSFDRLAPWYRLMERIAAGEKMQRCRVAFLEKIPPPKRVLLAGEGHGRFLPECTKRFPDAEIVVLDFSEKMLEIARRQCASDRVTFVRADLPTWDGAGGDYDLIVTHFFLDCFSPDALAKVVAHLGKLATPQANWLLADFDIPDSRWAGLRSRVILWLLYRFFKLSCGLRASELAVPDHELEQAGFWWHARITREWGLLKSEWWQR